MSTMNACVIPAAAIIFAQGDPATSVMHVEDGAVRLSVVSHAGKAAVIAVLEPGHFFGEGCLAGQSQRMASATAMAPATILAVEKQEWCGSSTPSLRSRIVSWRIC